MRNLAMVCAVVSLLGCGASLQQLKTRAALDLECEAGAISLQQVDKLTQQASGCGKRAIYVQQYNQQQVAATWLLNSEIHPAESATR